MPVINIRYEVRYSLVGVLLRYSFSWSTGEVQFSWSTGGQVEVVKVRQTADSAGGNFERPK